jgi:hypothetical protein
MESFAEAVHAPDTRCKWIAPPLLDIGITGQDSPMLDFFQIGEFFNVQRAAFQHLLIPSSGKRRQSEVWIIVNLSHTDDDEGIPAIQNV